MTNASNLAFDSYFILSDLLCLVEDELKETVHIKVRNEVWGSVEGMVWIDVRNTTQRIITNSLTLGLPTE